MGTAFLSNSQTVDIFQFPSLLPVFCPDFPDQLSKVLLHLLPCGALTFFVCKSHPVISRGEVPLDQSSYISLSSPLILLGDLLRGGSPLFFSFLSPGTIPSCMLFLYLYGAAKIPCLSDICPPHIASPVVSLIPLIELPRGFRPWKKVKNIAGFLLLSP